MAPGKSRFTEFPDPLYLDSYVIQGEGDNYKAAMIAYVGHRLVRVVVGANGNQEDKR
jgi:hypothetical protein